MQWTRARCLPFEVIACNPSYNLQFTHLFYTNVEQGVEIESKHFEVLQPLLNKIDFKKLLKVKANLTINRGEQYEVGYHVDVKEPYLGIGNTSIFYINTTNGGTNFKNGDKVEGVGNRLITFPNTFSHSAVTHTTNAVDRAVININWM